jgi:hypothetical protein
VGFDGMLCYCVICGNIHLLRTWRNEDMVLALGEILKGCDDEGCGIVTLLITVRMGTKELYTT